MKKIKFSLMIAFMAIGITAAFAFKGNANFSCSGQLFYLHPDQGFQPVSSAWVCLEAPQVCIYYEDEQGNKRPCDEPLGIYTSIAQ